jgi:hypothetical protein
MTPLSCGGSSEVMGNAWMMPVGNVLGRDGQLMCWFVLLLSV